jgi:nucleotide-binding universal stress UspA family protein
MSVMEHHAQSDLSYEAPLHGGPVVVACDGAAASQESLFAAAQCVSDAFGGDIQVLGVCAPTPGVAAGMDALPVPLELDEMRRLSMLEDVRRAVSIAVAAAPSWPSDVLVGPPPRVLASEAARRGASMLVMGIGRHNPLDRLFGTETTLATLRESSVPVLAVGPHFAVRPQLAVVGLDFSDASIHAAHLALRLIGPTGKLTLVHVRPRFEHPSSDWQAWDADYGRTLPPLFEKVRTHLNATSGVIVETVTVRGDPAPALLAVAQQANADLIAVGTQRHSFIERLVVGSVATRVLRTARCAVLAVPAVA